MAAINEVLNKPALAVSSGTDGNKTTAGGYASQVSGARNTSDMLPQAPKGNKTSGNSMKLFFTKEKQIERLHDTVVQGGGGVERGNLLVSLRNAPEDVRKHLSTDVLAWWLCADMSDERGKCLSAIRELPVTEKLKVLGATIPALEKALDSGDNNPGVYIFSAVMGLVRDLPDAERAQMLGCLLPALSTLPEHSSLVGEFKGVCFTLGVVDLIPLLDIMPGSHAENISPYYSSVKQLHQDIIKANILKPDDSASVEENAGLLTIALTEYGGIRYDVETECLITGFLDSISLPVAQTGIAAAYVFSALDGDINGDINNITLHKAHFLKSLSSGMSSNLRQVIV